MSRLLQHERRALRDSRYYEERRVPKWNIRPTLLIMAGHTGAGPHARHAFPELSKADHAQLAVKYAKAAGREKRAYGKLLQAAIDRHGHPAGTYTSGIYNPAFPEPIKDRLRRHLGRANQFTSASVLHHEATGRRTPWRDTPLKKLAYPGEGLYGSRRR